jgi:uncharacterized protein DUF4386
VSESAAARPVKSRTIGIVYLLFFLAAPSSLMLANRGFAAAGDTVNLVATGLYALLTLLFYGLFRPVSRALSLLAAVFGLVGCTLTVLGIVHAAAANVSPLLFFGPFCLLIGYLIVRSVFVPRILGWLMMLAGVTWLAFLVPSLSNALSVPSKVIGVVAEAALMMWLLIAGVDLQRWRQQDANSGGAAR